MSTTPPSGSRQAWPARLYGSSLAAETAMTLQITPSLLQRFGVDVPAGDVGVAMCSLPLDISLRAYAIDAIVSVAAARGFELLQRRDVPVRPEILGAAAFTRPHVIQFLFLRPVMMDGGTFERELLQLRATIECEMADLGMTTDDVQVVSCSARSITYPCVTGSCPATTLYPDLVDSADVSLANRFRPTIHRSWKLA